MTYPDNILFKVAKPARYTGGEWNSIVKDWCEADVRIAISYPDLYEIGMSNMALPILYRMLNSQPDVLAERVFAPWPDMAEAIRDAEIPLLSLESGRQLKDFDVIGFSLGYELTFTNVLNILHLSQIPVFSAERDDSHPLVIAGGSCALNPEPMADFIDLFVIGEVEEVITQLVSCFRSWRRNKLSKREVLLQTAAIPGIYVPSLYGVEYQTGGSFKSITPISPQASPTIKRQIAAQLPLPVTDPVVPYIEVVHDRGAIEISRGCTRGCRFCNAGIIYRPVRLQPREAVLTAVDDIIASCGYDEVSLVSLSTGDYPDIEKLVNDIAVRYKKQNLNISLPSLRIDSELVKLVGSLSSHRKMGLTFAPEAGSRRLQQVINKCIPEEELVKTAAAAFERGWKTLKLYFMLGLPTETEEDVESIAQLVNKVHALGKNFPVRRPQIRVSLSTFIPKPHTPFQWAAQEDEQQLSTKHEIVRAGLRRKGIRLSWQEPKFSLLEAVLSRGDRRVGQAIHRAWQLGACFDGWSEHFSYEIWLKAFGETGIDPAFYANRQRPLDEPLPWGHIDTGISMDFLKREYQHAIEGKETPDCRNGACNACGLEKTAKPCIEKVAERKVGGKKISGGDRR
ncbi:MAG TPA: TIGR03960 family B12-binding radical SAM protein [Dehalococcoidia bacterium]|nr:TIGR03960 family B12-binding radical SAM protein [Dehalococcoidia bacterium]